MSSQKQKEANRKNALASTGPRTVEGKLVSSKNAMRHGLLSRVEVLPRMETLEEWEAHFRQTMEDLRPVGYVERFFAERMALNIWRLLRLARYERDTAAFAIEQAAKPPATLTYWAQNFEQQADFARRLPGIPDDEKTDKSLTANLISNVAELAGGVDLWGDKGSGPIIDLPNTVPLGVVGWQQTRDLYEINWDARFLRKVLTIIADRMGRTLTDLLKQVEGDTRAKAAEERKRLEQVGDRLSRLHALLSKEELEKVLRYETHLDRSLLRYFNELQRLQAARAGERVQPPATLDLRVNVHPVSPVVEAERTQGFMLNDPSPLFAKRTQSPGSA